MKIKLKATLWISLILGILGTMYFYSTRLKRTRSSLAAVLPHIQDYSITKFAPGKIPCLRVEIEGKKYIFELDLGFDGEVSVTTEYLQQITDKTFLNTAHSVGFRGNSYLANIYSIPAIELGRVKFKNRTLKEESPKFTEDSAIIPVNDPEPCAGRLGCKLFQQLSLFLDLGNSKVILCDTVETFKEQGYSLEDFAQIPFFFDHNLVECEVATPEGLLRCLIDTGCTSNILNADNLDHEPFENLIKDEKYHVKFSSIQIGGKDMGEITFRKVPLKFPFHIDAILGMEFFFHHQVFIDFKNNQIYFSPSHQLKANVDSLKDVGYSGLKPT